MALTLVQTRFDGAFVRIPATLTQRTDDLTLYRFAVAAGFCLLLAGCATPSGEPQSASPAPRGTSPYRWLGQTGANLRAALGAPAFARRDGTASLWRYDGAHCHVFFFLYGDTRKDANAQVVRHIDTLPEGPNGGVDRECLSALRLSAKSS